MSNILLYIDSITNGFRIEFVDIIYLISIFFGILTIVNRNPIFSVLFLIGLFVNTAVLLILVGYNFLGLAYILVYVGAVSILFLFILMLINIRISELLSETNNDIPLGLLTISSFYYFIWRVLPSTSNLVDSPLISFIKKTISYIYDAQWGNELFILMDIHLKQIIAYASSNGWDSLLIELTHIASIGNIMYTSYSIWLIISSIILLLGMVGAIVITIKGK